VVVRPQAIGQRMRMMMMMMMMMTKPTS
jgi:hypothetical protein